MSISQTVSRTLPRLPQAAPIAGAAVAALVAVAASSLVPPALIIAGVLGLIALLSMRANLQSALLGLAFARATLEGTYLLPAANVGGLALGLGDILTLGFFGGVLWYLAGRARAGTLAHLWRAPTVVPVLAFLGLAGFSLLYSQDATQGARDILKFASAFSVYLLLVADPPDARRLRLLLIGIAVGSVVPIAAGFAQLLTGGAELNEFQGWSRVQSVFVDPNTYGFYLVTVLAAAWALRGQVSDKARSWLDLLSLAAFASVFLTLSRNSVAALAILVLVIGTRQRRILIPAVAVTAIVLLASPQVGSRGTQILSPTATSAGGEVRRGDNATRTSLTGRLEIWGEGLQLWRQHPLLGVGFGGTSAALERNAHNDYLRSLVEAGLVGLGCFAAVVLSIVRLGRRAGAGRSDAPRVLMGLSLGYVLVSYFSNNLGKNVFQFHFWLLAGILYVWAERVPISRPSIRHVRQNVARVLQLRVRLNDGRTVEGFAQSDRLFDDGLLLLTRVTHTFDSGMNEIVATPLDASIARNQVVDFLEIIEGTTTPPAAAGDDLRQQEPESPPDGEETLHVRLSLRDGRTVEGLARPDASFDVDEVLVLTRVIHVFDSDMNELPATAPDGVIPCDEIVQMQEVAGALEDGIEAATTHAESSAAVPRSRLETTIPSHSESETEAGPSVPEPESAHIPILTAPRPAPDLPPRDDLAVGQLRIEVAQTRVRGAHVSVALFGAVALALGAFLLASALSSRSTSPAASGASEADPDQSPATSAAPFGGAEEIAFLRDLSGVPQIYLLELPEGSPVRLTPSDTEQQRPEFSPDGDRLAYSAKADGRQDIFVSRSDGTGAINVTNNDSDDYVPAFSPDGQSIVFASNLVDDFDIYVLDLPSGEPRAVVDNDAQDTSPAWSPDGETIVFASQMDGDFDLYTADAGGSGNPVKITNNTVDDRAPAWSPDGSALVFDRTVDRDTEIFVVTLGAEERQITDNGVEDRHPAWSPDGEGVFYGRETPDGHELYFKSLTPGSHRILVDGGAGGYDPAVR